MQSIKGKFIADDFFFQWSVLTFHDISAKQTVHMKCQDLLYWEKKNDRILSAAVVIVAI